MARVCNYGKCKDKNCVNVGEEVSVGGEGGEGEADEGDAAGVRGGQGEQAKKQIYCSHLKSSLVLSFFSTNELSWCSQVF